MDAVNLNKTQQTTYTQKKADNPIQVTKKQENEIQDGEKKINKGLIALGIIGAAGVAISTAVAIGRNPQNAAKVLKGTSEYIDDIYKAADKNFDDLIGRNEFGAKFQELVSELQGSSKSKANDLFEEVSTLLKNTKDVPDDINKAMDDLLKCYQDSYNDLMKTIRQGDHVSYEELSSVRNKSELNRDKIAKFLRELGYNNENSEEYRNLARKLESINTADFEPKGIFDCPDELLPKDKIYYHGTRHAKGIYQSGLSPYVSNQLTTGARELGAGIYVTPNVDVAAGFSGMHGDIIPVKLSDDARVAFIGSDAHDDIFKKLQTLIGEEMGLDKLNNMPKKEKNALFEVALQKLFKDSGYDAVYTPKGYRSGFCFMVGDINEKLGTGQSQLAIFSPEKTEIVSRNFKERVGDLRNKNKTQKALMEYQRQHAFML